MYMYYRSYFGKARKHELKTCAKWLQADKIIVNHMNLLVQFKFRNIARTINNDIYFFLVSEQAEFSKSCNLIGSESGRFFTFLPAEPGGIAGSFIHKFVCCL